MYLLEASQLDLSNEYYKNKIHGEIRKISTHFY